MNFKQSVLQGVLPKDLRIFDAHAHVGEGEYSGIYLYTLPLAQNLCLMKKAGINAMAASSFKSLGGSAAAGNERLMEMCAIHPEELFAYLYYEPRYSYEVFAQLDTYRSHPSFIGVKIHPRESKTSLESSDYDMLYAYCETHGILILCHTWATEPENNPSSFTRILKRHPKLKLLLGHMGGTYRGCMDSIALANEYKNVYLDINGSLYSQIWIEELVKLAPLNKFIFSTDQVFNDPRIIVGRVLLSDLKDEEKKAILCDNFETVMGRQLVRAGGV